MTLIEQFRHYITQQKLLRPDERVLLTVSGGVDSMVMLSLFARSGYTVGVAHCNFQLRGTESEEDEEVVARVAASLGVPCYNRRFDTREEMERTGESVQMAARRLRYAWFSELSAEHGYEAIAIAHHADDSIETFFINLLRGTGLKGLTGIHSTRGRIIRPLLFASRHDITEYAVANRIPFREDSSNRSTKYLRNKVRLGLVPCIREINPRFTEVMAANIGRLTETQRFIGHAIEKIRGAVCRYEAGMEIIDVERIDPRYPRGFVIYELLSSAYGFKGDVTDALVRSLEGGGTGRRFYSKEWTAWIDRGRIVLAPIADDDPCTVTIPHDLPRAHCGGAVLHFEREAIDVIEHFAVPECMAQVDDDKLTYPLELRRWREGDWFVPYGMEGRKKVSDFLVDCKVPMEAKRRQFVLCSGEHIVWVVGRRIDDRFRLTPATENVLRITQEVV